MVLSTVSRARDPTSDAPCRAQLLPRKTPGVRQEPDPISSTPRQSRRLLRIRAPSIDECSLARARHRSHGFAAARRLPKPVRPSCAPRSPALCLEARPFASPRGPGFVRRLLQPKRSASTCCEPSDPWTPWSGCPLAGVSGGVSPRLAPSPKTRSVSARSQSRFLGPGAEGGFRHSAPLVWIARDESFAPTRWARTSGVVGS
jgi:hypothetical protein